MRSWETALVIVTEKEFDHDLHVFEVYNKKGVVVKLLGTIYPDSIQTMQECIADLDDGKCPIAEGWEDGKGNACTLDGWDIAKM